MTANASKTYEIDVENIEYVRHGDKPLLARLFKPRDQGPFPAMVELHGGAWCLGDRLIDRTIMRGQLKDCLRWGLAASLAALVVLSTSLGCTKEPVHFTDQDCEILVSDYCKKGGAWSFLITPREAKSWKVIVLGYPLFLKERTTIQVGSATAPQGMGGELSMKVLELFDATKESWNIFIQQFAKGMDKKEVAA